jgi:membrane-bound lytic murein transglycosylase B
MKKWLVAFVLAITLILFFIGTQFESKVKRGLIEFSLDDNSIPDCYIPIYKDAADTFSIPWTLLAAIHRVETVFSTMDPMISHVGAVGHFQFMPRTWVGWGYPGTPLGDITDGTDITDISLIDQFGGYGTDATGNGKADPFDITDATFSAAKYLAEHGADNNEFDRALLAYNHSQEYVSKVMHYYQIYIEDFEAKKLTYSCYK